MADAGMNVAPLAAPTATPLAGWEVITEADIAKKLQRVTSGNVVFVTCSGKRYTFSQSRIAL